MNKLVLGLLLSVGFALVSGSEVPQDSDTKYQENSALVEDQAQQDYAQHQHQVQNQGYQQGREHHQTDDAFSSASGSDGSLSFNFDRQGSDFTRDRGYGFEKAYAYSRETAFLDFLSDRAVLNAKDLVENEGKVDSTAQGYQSGHGSLDSDSADDRQYGYQS